MIDAYIELGRQGMKEELVCRLLAADMPVDEIAMLLIMNVDEVEYIKYHYSNSRIPVFVWQLEEYPKLNIKVEAEKILRS